LKKYVGRKENTVNPLKPEPTDMSYLFDKTGGGEQFYGTITGTNCEELMGMIAHAANANIELVAVCDAENAVVMITTRRAADLLLPILNDTTIQPLDSLSYLEAPTQTKAE
jgi:hypothetical protein